MEFAREVREAANQSQRRHFRVKRAASSVAGSAERPRWISNSPGSTAGCGWHRAGRSVAVELEAERAGLAGLEGDPGEARSSRVGRATAGDRVADEEEEVGGAGARAGVGDGGGDCDPRRRCRSTAGPSSAKRGVAEAVAEGELRAVRQVEVLAGVLACGFSGPAAGARGIADRDLADVARPGDGEAAPTGARRRSGARPPRCRRRCRGTSRRATAAAPSKTSGIDERAAGEEQHDDRPAGGEHGARRARPGGRAGRCGRGWRPRRSSRRPRRGRGARGRPPRGGDGLGDAVGRAALDRDARDVGRCAASGRAARRPASTPTASSPRPAPDQGPSISAGRRRRAGRSARCGRGRAGSGSAPSLVRSTIDGGGGRRPRAARSGAASRARGRCSGGRGRRGGRGAA